MIRVGFLLNNVNWTGGINYFKNLLFALSKYPSKNIEVIVFVGKKTKEKEVYGKYAEIIEYSFFDIYSIKNILGRIGNKLFHNKTWYLQKILKKHRINILSHSPFAKIEGIKTITWIPDFQHIHLPEFFTKKELKFRDEDFLLKTQESDGLILSSYDALDDLKKFLNGKKNVPVFILHFVSQPDEQYFRLAENDEKKLKKKYNLPDIFFYLPNQMWAHKNHITVFKAVKILKSKGISTCVVCTGNMQDYRNKEYIQNVLDFVSGNNLEENIKLLGLLDYEEVFALIRFSKAVINPSLFEGWSSTVEECKGVGKPMILSDLAVHKEQYPNAVFFERINSGDLAEKMEKYNEYAVNSIPNFNVEQATTEFAKMYEKIVFAVLNKTELD
jgi:glycosyltransferase involved in cell wall biosynthesis